MENKRLLQIIDDVLAWGADHNQEFRECLIGALGITAEEFKEMFDEDLEKYIKGDY